MERKEIMHYFTFLPSGKMGTSELLRKQNKILRGDRAMAPCEPLGNSPHDNYLFIFFQVITMNSRVMECRFYVGTLPWLCKFLGVLET